MKTFSKDDVAGAKFPPERTLRLTAFDVVGSLRALADVVYHARRVVKNWEKEPHCNDSIFNNEIRMLKDAVESLILAKGAGRESK